MSTSSDDNVSPRLSSLAALFLNIVNELLALDNLAKDCMLAIQPGTLDSGDEELTAIGVRACIRHRQ